MMRSILFIVGLTALNSCSANNAMQPEIDKIIKETDSISVDTDTIKTPSDSIKHYLALGDSYTIGESVATEKRFPAQLTDMLNNKSTIELDVEIIAKTGWTTNDLMKAMDLGSKKTTYDFVTLLIGVNNQYSHLPFKTYEKEFPIVLKRAIKLAGHISENVIVVSIPDYAFTPFGNGFYSQKISEEIDTYNAFAKSIATANNVIFINITDITRKGLQDPELVASDGLHPSGKAYRQFVERIYPKALAIVE